MPDDQILADIAGHTMIELGAAPAAERDGADAAPPPPRRETMPRQAPAPAE